MTEPKLYVRDEGTGRPLVLIHGWSCPGQFFQRQIDALKGQARCIVPDLPGHGRTGAALPLDIESAARSVHAYLEEQDLTDAILCGWSMGALVSYAMIQLHGVARVSSVVAIDMSPKVLNAVDWANGTLNGLNEALNANVLAGIVPDWSRLPARIAGRLFAGGQNPDPNLLEYSRVEIAKADPALLQSMWASLTAQDFRRFLREFPLPLHLIAGLKSQLYGPGVHRWHLENVPRFTLCEFENSGHAPHLEEADRFNQLIADLLHNEKR
ncbi:MAG: alpha/beta hydrolase [Roseibium sp.]|uniref:alpha/beta fold hydrolase n=1 Tax=Roseibium sp. TaxID=1936156 RepID=UPI001B10830B|nr:alpha/beta hydrolase [Roseibium sp.]MBO6894553.1 alpha/beta hydrolase [Roseibium sp.]MBO6929491.1 alpha/beta hydrolase [Roseibium sp.]